MNRFIWFVVLLFVLAACSAPTPPPVQPTAVVTIPQVIISTPASGTQVVAGADVIIQSTSADAQGITRVELFVDNQSVRADPIPTGKSQPQFQVVQTWKATTPGAHIVIVRATNEKGATGEAALSLTVTEPPKPTNTPVPTAAPTAVPPTVPPPTATRAPAPTQAAVSSSPVPTAAPAVNQFTYTVNEEQFNIVVDEAMPPRVVQYANNAVVKLQDSKITITANYFPINTKPTIAAFTLTANASNCNLSISMVSASLGITYFSAIGQAAFAQSVEQRLKYQLGQQRPYTCVDSVAVGGGVMTIKYH